jgi:hypothetical protein
MTDLLSGKTCSQAPGSAKPYVRAELQFPVTERPDEEIKSIRQYAQDAITYAMNNAERFTVECVYLTDQGKQPGTHLSAFIYDNNMGSYEGLTQHLADKKHTIMARFDSVCPLPPRSPRL